MDGNSVEKVYGIIMECLGEMMMVKVARERWKRVLHYASGVQSCWYWTTGGLWAELV
ncbi:hypothetical protein Fmac_005575 [Flemingia macrophylla]|uniref:Uncharacterized protein n=1 Tax=Flemingia macrophylla TaxID=520843 RepID=A0ABD1N888_9FABA